MDSRLRFSSLTVLFALSLLTRLIPAQHRDYDFIISGAHCRWYRCPWVVGDLYGKHGDCNSFGNILVNSRPLQVFGNSDLRVNIVTARTTELLKTRAEHDDMDAIWSFTDEANVAAARRLSIGNLKHVFTNEGRGIDWFDAKQE